MTNHELSLLDKIQDALDSRHSNGVYIPQSDLDFIDVLECNYGEVREITKPQSRRLARIARLLEVH